MRCSKGKNCIIDTNDIPVKFQWQNMQKHREWISMISNSRFPKAMGELLQGLFENGLDATVMVTGGDILMGMIRALDIGGITPIQELFTEPYFLQ